MKYILPIMCLLVLLTLGGCYVDNINEEEDAARLNEQQINEYVRTNNLSVTTTPSGLRFTKLVASPNPNAQIPQTGDSVTVHYTVRLMSGTVVDSTSPFRNRPEKFIVGLTGRGILTAAGLTEGLSLMREGERALMIMPASLAFGSFGTTVIPPYSALIYDVTILDIRSEEEQIADFITRKGYNPASIKKTESGLRYIKKSDGSANTAPVTNQRVIVNYKGTLLDDTRFDERTDSTFAFVLGTNQVIRGWDEGLRLTNEGEVAMLIIPSSLGYGASGAGGGRIPPYSPLFFEITHVKSERRRIIEFLVENNIARDTSSTASGVYSRIEVAGSGAQPTASSQVRIYGEVRLLDGTVVASIPIGSPTYNLADGTTNTDLTSMTAGLREGVLLMRLNETRRIIVPSTLAFGSRGRGRVPGKTPVQYIITLQQIIN